MTPPPFMLGPFMKKLAWPGTEYSVIRWSGVAHVSVIAIMSDFSTSVKARGRRRNHGIMEWQATESLFADDEVACWSAASCLLPAVHAKAFRCVFSMPFGAYFQCTLVVTKWRWMQFLKELMVSTLTTSAGRLFQWRMTRLEKKLLKMSVLHRLDWIARLLFLVLVLVCSSKSLEWSTLLKLFIYLKTWIISPRRRLFSNVKRLSRLSRSSYDRAARKGGLIFVALRWILSSNSISFL